ncbi:RNA-binding cell elongation regulator Jag/EloR [Spirochaeta lutea]|uniref:RNA-binding protein KhpB n=1 Tax=Spirochaeta lutea TaxID=1480694 RepID=A0A098QWJ3_9SPIO|nr:RNA-binding cell elongation regulator Jag/EloR [Spirochaeta lutea]KGE71926.1 single-stranded DNA-binding protein [Spirochaeta lutea]
MVHEFEGRTEKEAIDTAVQSLGLTRDEFDVEILETQKSGLFNLSKKVRIRVFTRNKGGDSSVQTPILEKPRQQTGNQVTYGPQNPDPENDFEHAVFDFIGQVTEKMGFPATPVILYREAEKLGIRLDSEHSGILIGKKGKNLDALQLLVNVLAARMIGGDFRVVIDTENYRSRREEALIRLAEKTGDQVKRTKKSRLLEPMNPFERRLIHTALNNISDIETKSEGDGLYKQVRVIYKGLR